jgi:hypothetical protein
MSIIVVVMAMVMMMHMMLMMLMLMSRPQAKKDWKETDSVKDAMKVQTARLLEKKRLLLQYAPGSAVDTTEVRLIIHCRLHSPCPRGST